MDRHPIPKNLLDVEFKLFGSLTVKQFGSLSIFFAVALFFYLFKTLPGIIRWPAVVGFALVGLAFAFIEVNGQPFSKWLGNFMIAIVTPQRRIWKKSPTLPKTLVEDFHVSTVVRNKNRTDRGLGDLSDIVQEKKLEQDEDELTGFESKVFANIDNYMQNDSMYKNFKENIDATKMVVNERIARTSNSSFGNQTQKVQNQAIEKQHRNFGQQVPEIKGQIYGKVVDMNNAPCQYNDVLIRDNKFNPVRQMKTNLEGIFLSSTPLEEGVYYVTASGKEKDQRFQTFEVRLSNQPIRALLIKEVE